LLFACSHKTLLMPAEGYTALVGINVRKWSCIGKLKMEVCPTEVIHAPVQHVWHLLADPRQLAQWSRAKLDEGPQRPVRAGDHFILRKSGMRIGLQVVDANPFQHLTLDVHFPFGIVNHEQVQLTALGTTACRVTFN
jgi:hypothetical protein